LFSPKFRTRERGWKSLFEKNKKILESLKTKKKVWIHSASMGEFEQAKPIIEYFKNNYPDIDIIATFFSPSGYEHQKNYPFADVILYLPFDTPKNAKEFVSAIKPDFAIFIKYELWVNFLVELKRQRIPVFLVCASKPFRFADGWINRAYFKYAYNLFTMVFPVSENDFDYFENLKLKCPLELIYDTRYDRVAQKIASPKTLPFDRSCFDNHFVLVAGSIWDKDIELIVEAKNKLEAEINLKIIYVPHEPTEQRLKFIESLDPKTIRFSNLVSMIEGNHNIEDVILGKNILVDRVGLLLDLYSLGDVAYVGGGFGRGIHSVIEPLGYGLPIFCGGNISNSPEAVTLEKSGILKVVQNSGELENWLSKFYFDKNLLTKTSDEAMKFFSNRLGSTEKIVKRILLKIQLG